MSRGPPPKRSCIDRDFSRCRVPTPQSDDVVGTRVSSQVEADDFAATGSHKLFDFDPSKSLAALLAADRSVSYVYAALSLSMGCTRRSTTTLLPADTSGAVVNLFIHPHPSQEILKC